MVIVRLEYGLGNQMFQYAAGRALAARLKTRLALDTIHYQFQKQRCYELSHLNVRAEFPSAAERLALRFSIGRRSRIARGIVKRLWPDAGFRTVVDPAQGFDSSVFDQRGNVYLKGFWQSEKYFEAVADEIKREFTFRDPPDEENRRMLEAIRSSNSVCLHVRRGDMLNYPLWDVCGLDYYKAAVERISGLVESPNYFVFSDDPQWVKSNLGFVNPSTLVTHNTGKRDPEDLRLMMHCKHFVIANSTFSWWGAWLGSSKEKVVIAPRRWHAGPESFVPDILPGSWITV